MAGLRTRALSCSGATHWILSICYPPAPFSKNHNDFISSGADPSYLLPVLRRHFVANKHSCLFLVFFQVEHLGSLAAWFQGVFLLALTALCLPLFSEHPLGSVRFAAQMFVGGRASLCRPLQISQGSVVPITVDSAMRTTATYGLSLPISWIIPWLYSILCLFLSKILHVNHTPWSFRGWWEFPSSQELDLLLQK